MSEEINHRKLAVAYYNAAWDLIDRSERTPGQDRDMIGVALTSRQHWIEAGGTDENLTVADWQVAHAASLAGFGQVALSFAQAAVDRADSSDVPTWLKASTHEGLARANAALGDKAGYRPGGRGRPRTSRDGPGPRGPRAGGRVSWRASPRPR